GHVDATGDPLDGFRLRVPARVQVTLSFSFLAGAQHLDLSVYDRTTLQVVASVEAVSSPTVLSFPAKGAIDLVIGASAGATSYQLVVDAATLAIPTIEQEPNGSPSDARYVGEVTVGDVLTLAGHASATDDPVDAFLVPCPSAMTLSLSLAFPAFQDFDVLVLDATESVLAPTPLASFSKRGGGPEAGAGPGPAGSLPRIRGRPLFGSADHTPVPARLAP